MYKNLNATSKMILPNCAPSTQTPTKELCRKQNKTHFLQNETQKLENRRKKKVKVERNLVLNIN